MDFKQEVLEEVLEYRNHREPNIPTIDISGLFKNGICDDVTLLLRNREVAEGSRRRDDPTRVPSLNVRRMRRKSHVDQYVEARSEGEDTSVSTRTNKEPDPESLGDVQHEIDGEGEMVGFGENDDDDDGDYEMILGDIPEVTIPSSRHDALLKRRTSSVPSAKRTAPKKKRVSKHRGGEAGEETPPPSAQASEVSASSRYACRKCSLIFSKFEFLNAHMSKIHPVVGPYRCPNCVFETKFHSMLLLHMKEPHAGDTRKINAKHKKVTGKRVDEPRMKCPLCAYEASSLANFTSHSRISHRNVFEKFAHQNASSTRHRCPFRPACSYQAKDRNALENHYKSEHKQRLWHCPECDFYTVWKVALNRHLKAHRENPKHKCDACGQRFALRTYLDRHYMERECEEVQAPQDQSSDSNVDKVSSSPASRPATPMSTPSIKALTSDGNGGVLPSMSSPTSFSGREPPTGDDPSLKTESPTTNTTATTDLSAVMPEQFPAKSVPVTVGDSPSEAQNSLSLNANSAPSTTAAVNGGHAIPSAQDAGSEIAARTADASHCTTLAQMLYPNANKSRSSWTTSQLSPSPIHNKDDKIYILNGTTPLTISADRKVPSNTGVRPEPYEVIDLTDNDPPVSACDDPLGVPVAPLDFSQNKITVRKLGESKSSRGPLTPVKEAIQCTTTSSSHKTSTSVTIVWDSELPGIVKGFRSDEKSGNAAIAATSTVQVQTCDGSPQDEVSAVKEPFDSTVSSEVTSRLETERNRSNLSTVFDQCPKESHSPQNCDIDFTNSAGSMIISGYREASPPLLVIDDGITSD